MQQVASVNIHSRVKDTLDLQGNNYSLEHVHGAPDQSLWTARPHLSRL
jgi:hypothetical protein